MSEFSDEALRHPGVAVTFQAIFEGYQDRARAIRWTMLAVDNDQRVTDEANLVDQAGSDAKTPGRLSLRLGDDSGR